MTTNETAPAPVTAGCTLEVLKGAKEVWVQSTTGRPAHYAAVRVRDHLRVVAAEEISEQGFRVTIERAHERFHLWARSGAWTRHAEFNLRAGLSDTTIRVRVAKRPVAPIRESVAYSDSDGDSAAQHDAWEASTPAQAPRGMAGGPAGPADPTRVLGRTHATQVDASEVAAYRLRNDPPGSATWSPERRAAAWERYDLQQYRPTRPCVAATALCGCKMCLA